MVSFQSNYSGFKSTKFWVLFFLLFLVGCGEGPPDSIVVADKKFRTTPPSRIFFKNIRSTAYQWEQETNSRTDFYLLRKIARADDRPLLYPLIADIWMEDQAQVILKSGQYDELPLPLLVHWQSKEDTGSYRMDSLSADQMYELSLNIYRSLRSAHALEISYPQSPRTPLFRDQTERSFFLTSMYDYLRLTEFKE